MGIPEEEPLDMGITEAELLNMGIVEAEEEGSPAYEFGVPLLSMSISMFSSAQFHLS